MVNRILPMAKPLTKILLACPGPGGVNAFGTSSLGNTIVSTKAQAVSSQPFWLIATRQALNVPVALYWCSTAALLVVISESPSPNSHLNRIASGEELFVKR